MRPYYRWRGVFLKSRCNKCRKLIDYGETFCSECKSKVTKERKNGLKDKEAEATLKTSRWRALSKRIKQRDKCCLVCLNRGFIEYRGLQVHHLIKRTENLELAFEPSNLVTVCRICHEELEKLPLEKQKVLLGNYNKELDFIPL